MFGNERYIVDMRMKNISENWINERKKIDRNNGKYENPPLFWWLLLWFNSDYLLLEATFYKTKGKEAMRIRQCELS